jgi:hypothetical protein
VTGSRKSPQKGAELATRKGWTEARPAKGARARRTRRAAIGHSIAPTEFPKVRSAAVGTRVVRPLYAAACALQVEETRPWTRPKADTSWGIPPRI